jgi:hypothetical protein
MLDNMDTNKEKESIHVWGFPSYIVRTFNEIKRDWVPIIETTNKDTARTMFNYVVNKDPNRTTELVVQNKVLKVIDFYRPEIKKEQKSRIYIVFRDTIDDYVFIDVFFTEEAAKEYVARQPSHRRFNIETFEETDGGKSKEIY